MGRSAKEKLTRIQNEMDCIVINEDPVFVETEVANAIFEYYGDISKIHIDKYKIGIPNTSCTCGVDIGMIFRVSPHGVASCFHCKAQASVVASNMNMEMIKDIAANVKKYMTDEPIQFRSRPRVTSVDIHPDMVEDVEVNGTKNKNESVSEYGLVLLGKIEEVNAGNNEILSALQRQPMVNRSTYIFSSHPGKSERGLHVDPVDAFNLAFKYSKGEAVSIEGEADAIIATWYFFRPCTDIDVIKDARTFFATSSQIPKYTEEMKGKKMWGKDVVILHQKHGDLVHVPVGWPHFVYNNKANVKIAFDTICKGNLRMCAHVWKNQFRSMNIKGEEYFGVISVLSDLAMRYLSPNR